MDLVKLANKSTSYNLEAKQANCLRKFKSNDCDKCLKSCPEKAISLDNRSISLDELSCNNCGICLTTCPASAFESEPSLTVVCINQINKEGTAIFACENSAQKNAIEVSCLAALSVTTLIFGALKTGSTVLVADKCDSCSLFEKAKGVIEKNVSDANSVLGCIEKNRAEVSLANTPFLIDKHISRNDFFNSIKKTLIDVGAETLLEKLGQENKSLSDTDILMSILKKQNVKNKVRELPFFTLGLKDSCNYCLKCASICPTGAVYSVVEDKNIKLVFESAKCNGCNLCLKACSAGCLSISNKTDLSKFGKEIVLSKGEANYCATCSTLVSKDKTHCPKCQKKADISETITSLFD